MIKTLLFAILIVITFGGCCPKPVPCDPVVIHEPFEVDIPVGCQHPSCPEPNLYNTDINASYFERAKLHKANDKLKKYHKTCLNNSIKSCELNSTTENISPK